MGIEFASSNISSEHFIGMSGEGFQTGLAIAAFEWIAAIALVFVALVLLPRFLQAGIYTLPEYLEFRFGPIPRVIMAAYLMTVYVVVGLAGILYAGTPSGRIRRFPCREPGQTPPDAAGRSSDAPVDDLPHGHLGPEYRILGTEPVHFPASAGREESGRGPRSSRWTSTHATS